MNPRVPKLPDAAISVVVPIYNEEAIIPSLVARLSAVRERFGPSTLQVLLIDDGSSDGTAQLVDALCADAGFFGIHFSRNFGHQAAVSAGVDLATGDYIAIIDGDLQDPPELLPDMLGLLKRSEADVVYGVRRQRKESLPKKACYFLFYRLLDALTPIRIPLDSGDFCVMSRRVADAVRAMPERHRFVRGLRAYAGYKQIPFEYARDARAGGEPKYTLARLVRLGLDGIVGFSAVPLQVSTYVGFAVSLAALCYGMTIVIWRLWTQTPLPGFATIAVGLFFLGGIQLVSLGILGEYIGRIHSELKQRPHYIIASITGATSDKQ